MSGFFDPLKFSAPRRKPQVAYHRNLQWKVLPASTGKNRWIAGVGKDSPGCIYFKYSSSRGSYRALWFELLTPRQLEILLKANQRPKSSKKVKGLLSDGPGGEGIVDKALEAFRKE